MNETPEKYKMHNNIPYIIDYLNDLIDDFKRGFSIIETKEIIDGLLDENISIPPVWIQVKSLKADENYMDTLQNMMIEIVYDFEKKHNNSEEWEDFKNSPEWDDFKQTNEMLLFMLKNSYSNMIMYTWRKQFIRHEEERENKK